MARLDYPESSHVAEVMREFPPPLQNMNIGRMVSHAPTLTVPYYSTYAAALQSLELDPKLRQLAILRLAERVSAPYVLGQHRALAKLAGLTDVQISAAGKHGVDSTCYCASFTYVQRLVLAFVDEVVAGPRVSDELFERIHRVLTQREVIELLLVIGWYWTACRLTTTLDIEPEHALGQGVIDVLEAEQDQRSARSARVVGTDAPADAAARPSDYYAY